MNAIELFHADGKSAGIFHCEKCRHVAHSKELAEQCCKPYICECGAECEKYWTICAACSRKKDAAKEAERFAAAEKVTEWNDGMIYLEGYGNDGYCSDIGELEDEIQDAQEEAEESGEKFERPIYAWTCIGRAVCYLDYDAMIENATEEAYEGFDACDLDGDVELTAAIDAFNEKNKGKLSFEPNYERAILIPELTA